MKLLALIVNILALLSLIPTGMMAIMSPMMFDAPGSEKNTYVWLMAIAALLLPVLILITQIIAWVVFFRGNHSASLKIALIPLIDVAFLVCMLFLGAKQ